MMEKFLDSINLYPHAISFGYKDKIRIFSNYGLILSLISYTVMISLFYYFTYDLINVTNPKVKSIESEIDDSDTINLLDIINSFKLQIKINFNVINENINPEEIFNEKIYLYLEIYNRNEKNSTIYFYGNFSNEITNLSDSSEYEFSTDINMIITNDTKFENLDKNNQNEIRQLKDLNLLIKSSTLTVYFELQKPKNVTEFAMKKSNFFPSLVENRINIDESENYKINTKRSFSNRIQSYLHVKYNYIQMNTDSNPFFSYNEIDKFSKINFYYYTTNEINVSSDYINKTLLNIEFIDKYIFIRTYKKILDVLSQIGGIFNPIFILGKILIFRLNEKKYKLSILNDLFTEEDISNKIDQNTNFVDEREFENRINSFIIKKPCSFNGKSFKLFEKKKYLINQKKDSLRNPDNLKNIYNKINFIKDNSIKGISSPPNIEEKNVSKERLIKNIYNPSKNPIIKADNLSDNKETQSNIFKDESNLKKKDSSNIMILNDLSELKEEKRFIEIRDEDIKKHIKAFLNKQKKKKILLEYTSIEIIISSFCSKNNFNKELNGKEYLFAKIVKRFNYYLDITNIMRLFENFEKMKFILFNKYQLSCFDYMIHDINFNSDPRKEEESIFELTKYFNKKNFNEKNTDISIKKIMKNEIKHLIKDPSESVDKK